MIWYLVIATIFVLLAACGEAMPTSWPTTTPVHTETSEVDSAGVPDADSGDAATEVRDDKPGTRASDNESETEVVITESGLQIKDLVVGTGEQAREGAIVKVHYTGWLVDGTKFDSSVDRGTPFEFQLGQGRVIKGWDEGVATMGVGGVRVLTIPSELAYGDQGAGALIKAGDTLVFEIELLEVRNP